MVFHLYFLNLNSPILSIVPIEPKKKKKCFRNRLKIQYGVRKSSILGLLLFNINLIDMLYKLENSGIEIYDDDTTPYAFVHPTLIQLYMNHK